MLCLECLCCLNKPVDDFLRLNCGFLCEALGSDFVCCVFTAAQKEQTKDLL